MKRWTFLATDTVAYLPDSPVSGLSGVAGIGDVGAAPVQTGSSSLNELQSNAGTRLINTAAGSVQRSLTGRTSLTVSGTYNILRFPGSAAGIEYNRVSGTAGANHVVSARTVLGGSYFYSNAKYSIGDEKTTSQGANLTLSHVWSARTSSEFSGGPVYIKSTGVAGNINANFSASITHLRGATNYFASASRYTNTGGGVSYSNQSTGVSGGLSRKIGRFSNASARIGYTHFAILPSLLTVPYSVSGVSGSVEVSRSLSRKLSAYASYTFRQQNLPAGAVSVNALKGTLQTIGFGLTYTPRSINLGRQ